jgi:hypothetical protein
VEKYRPKTIEDVSAQEHTVAVLRKTLNSTNVRRRDVPGYAISTDCSFCSLCCIAATHALLWTARDGKDQCVRPLNS